MAMNIVAVILSAVVVATASAYPRRGIYENEPVLALVYFDQETNRPPIMAEIPVIAHQSSDEGDDQTKISTAFDASESSPEEFTDQAHDGSERLVEDLEASRAKRSTQPRGNNDQGNGDRGNVDVDVSRTGDGGTRVEASGRGTVWESRDGRGRAEVHGHYERERGGRHGNGRSNYGGGVRYSHRF